MASQEAATTSSSSSSSSSAADSSPSHSQSAGGAGGAGIENGKILSARYLEKASNKRDLVIRLRRILQVLRDDDRVEADSDDYPGLAALCHGLVRHVSHRDKEVRLYTVGACMELFAVYAPEAPWEPHETLDIFRQVTRQLANLAHATAAAGAAAGGATGTRQPHYYDYYRILELLAEVKIAVLLVDLFKTQDRESRKPGGGDAKGGKSSDTEDDDDDGPAAEARSGRTHAVAATTAGGYGAATTTISGEALQVLSELFRTLLQSVRPEHPTEISDFCQKALVACVEEFYESTIVPIPILDEILVCIGQGPRVLVLQQQQQPPMTSPPPADRSKKGGSKKPGPRAVGALPQYVQQANPSFLVASAVIRRSVDRLSTPIATLLNGLVNSDPRSIGQSSISSTHLWEDTVQGHDDDEAKDIASALEAARNLGRPQRQQQDTHLASNVWSIIYELHRVAPAVLTTVVGNLTRHVDTADVARRILVVQTLGKLFAGGGSAGGGGTNLARQYAPSYRMWLQRAGDRRVEVRQVMLPHLLAMASGGGGAATVRPGQAGGASPNAELAREAQATLLERLDKDPSAELRIEIIHGLCNLLNDHGTGHPSKASPSDAVDHRHVLDRSLMDGLGVRVTSKHKAERKMALTGLVQVYHRRYIRHHLSTVSEGGDDCPIEAVIQVMHRCCPLRTDVNGRSGGDRGSSRSRSPRRSRRSKDTPTKKRGVRHRRSENDDELGDDDGFGLQEDEDYAYYQWIPCKLFESASFTDAVDPDMRSRVVTLIDEVLLGSELPHPNNKLHMTSTARAVGLAVVVDSVQSQSPLASHWMSELLHTRARLQSCLKAYLDARGEISNQTPGTEEFYAADANAKDLLKKVAFLIPPPTGASPAPGEIHAVLEKFHAIRDKHVFRILGTLAHPAHSVKSRVRALDDLPKRVKSTAGDAVQAWVRSLVKRCAMGDFVNQDVVQRCVMLAHECFQAEQWMAAQKFLACAQLGADSFPLLCASDEVYGALTTFFRECSALSSSASRRKKIDHSGIVTTVSAILATASPHVALSKNAVETEEDLQKQLLRLCQDGTPEQARHAVATISALLKPKEDIALTEEQTASFLPLLRTLAAPSRLAIASAGSSPKLVCVLVALAELADHAPKLFDSSGRGENAIKFAFDMVLLGRAHSATANSVDEDREGDSSSDEDSDCEEKKTPRSRRPYSGKSTDRQGHLSPVAHASLVEDHNLSVTCRTLCAAIEFLSTYLRSSILAAKSFSTPDSPSTLTVSHDFIEKLFSVLSQILRDHGMPPSSRDRQYCNARQDRAALRQCAAIHLLRLCDTRLGLDQKHLTIQRWHILSSILLDDERVVRTAVMQELGLMLTGNGKYSESKGIKSMAPRLRFLAFLVLCSDGDHGADHTIANGNAANVGKCTHDTKVNAASCVAFLRRMFEAHSAESRAKGPEAENHFELHMKLTVMPECAVPYAYHLLTFRRETPSVAEKTTDEATDCEIDESCQKILRKRLKCLFDPLVQTLGDSADNISFLLRISEVLSKSFQPVGFNASSVVDLESSLNSSLSPSDASFIGIGKENDDGAKHQGKLLNVCTIARQVLFLYVKKDVNLETYPGTIRMPKNLFRKMSAWHGVAKSRTTAESGLLGIRERDRHNIQSKNENQNWSTRLGEADEAPPVESAMMFPSPSEGHAGNPPGREIETSRSHKTSAIAGDDDSSFFYSPSAERRRSKRKADSSLQSHRSAKIGQGTKHLSNHEVRRENESYSEAGSSSGSKRARRKASNQDEQPEEIGEMHGPHTRGTRKNSSTPSKGDSGGRVHFSPRISVGSLEKSNAFDDLSPINARASLDHASNMLSSGEKTRGTTPPSSMRKISATASLAPFDSPKSPTPVSESPSSKYALVKSVDRSGTPTSIDRPTQLMIESKRNPSERPSAGRKNSQKREGKENVVKAKGKRSIPQHIKIVRTKTNQGLKVAKQQPNRETRARKGGKQAKVPSIGTFEFDG